MNPPDTETILYHTTREANILPITSVCNASCIFCSHHGNPEDVRVIDVGVRPLADIQKSMAFLDPSQPVTIGESASVVIEGEPFAHPQIKVILTQLRSLFPDTEIRITTNGILPDAAAVALLSHLGGISVFISLNSVTDKGRRILMGNTPKQSEKARETLRLLQSEKIPFGVSLVAMPLSVSWDDVRETILFAASHGANDVRIFIPGFSDQASEELISNARAASEGIGGFLKSLPQDLPCPVLAEPSMIQDLRPEVSGVFPDSPAQRCGIKRGDVIRRIDGNKPRCRVEAWRSLSVAGVHEVEYIEGIFEVGTAGTTEAGIKYAVISSCEGKGSGITMEYDFDPARIDAVAALIESCLGKTLLLTSKLAYNIVKAVLALIGKGSEKAEAAAAENLTFGGNIMAAGLLALDDFENAYNAYQSVHGSPTQLLIPTESIDAFGFDLKGRHISELERSIRIPVIPA